MKRMICAALGLMLAATPVALAESGGEALILTATVEGLTPVALKAPASGELAAFDVREGDVLEAGQAVFSVEPIRVYADLDGTVADVYVKAGDIADAAVSRYGAALYLEHAERYQAQATTRTGYNTVENRDLRVGMKVYLRSANEKHFADGVITAVDEPAFTVQVLGGDLVYNQDVKIYREPDYNSKSLLARTKLSVVAPYAVTASGTVTEVAVAPGDAVKAGDYLFSYVPDTLEPERRGAQDATAVKTPEKLIVTAVHVQQGASVQKGQALLTAIPAGRYQLKAQVEEGDAHLIQAGDEMTVRFEELDMPAVEARVTAVSPLGTAEDVSRYAVYLAFDAPEGVWPGMHATLER